VLFKIYAQNQVAGEVENLDFKSSTPLAACAMGRAQPQL
jgi:hypothetical protein